MSERNIKVDFHGWLRYALEEYPNEACGFLYSEHPYDLEREVWHIFPCENIAEDRTNEWKPNTKMLAHIKKKAVESKLVKIGNVHTHPLPMTAQAIDDNIEFMRFPSQKDLMFARKFGDIVRGIFIVGEGKILGYRFHDMHGNHIPVTLVEGQDGK
jgi:proteasome lid subunit RPN8/RPN11